MPLYPPVNSVDNTIVSIKAFGAVGDGVTDDTAAVQAAFDSARSIFVPHGIYLCGALTIGSLAGSSVQFGKKIYGEGGSIHNKTRSSLIRWNRPVLGDVGSLLTVYGIEDLDLVDLVFDGDQVGANDMELIKFLSQNTPPTSRARVINCSFTDADKLMLVGSSSYQNDQIVFESCKFWSFRQYGLKVDSANGLSVASIRNCQFSCAGTGTANGIDLYAFGPFEIDTVTFGGAHNAAIKVRSAASQINNLTIRHTESEGSTYHLHVDNTVADDAHTIRFENNTVNSPVWIQGLARVVSSGNYFDVGASHIVLDGGARWLSFDDRANTGTNNFTVTETNGRYTNLATEHASTSGEAVSTGEVFYRPTSSAGGIVAEIVTQGGMRCLNWAPNAGFDVGAVVYPTNGNGHYYLATVAGTTGASPPSWTTDGSTFSDGTVTWDDAGTAAAVVKGFAPLDHYRYTAPPSGLGAGYWAAGAFLWNSAPATMEDPIGWSCVTGGTPGTWKPVYVDGGGPPAMGPLVGWYETDEGVALDGSDVILWAPRKGFGQELSQATPANRPTFSVVNGQGRVQIGASLYVASSLSTLFSGAPRTIFMVSGGGTAGGALAKLGSTVPNSTYYALNSNGAFYVDGSGNGNTAAGMVVSQRNVFTWTTEAGVQPGFRQNGVALTVSDVGTGLASSEGGSMLLTVGGVAGTGSDAYIQALLIYAGILDSTQIAKVESYLNTKYGVY